MTEDAIRTPPPGFYGSTQAEEVAPRTYFLPSFANVAAFATDEGVLLVDSGHALVGETLVTRLRSFTAAPVHSVVFTHGHVDHAFGIGAFEREAAEAGRARPRRFAHERIVDRFKRYALTRGLNEAINRTQFGVEEVKWPDHFPWPDVTYADRLTLRLGGERFELRHAMGETDDATWVWAPERGVVCSGDFFIWSSPNCGNPQKVQRYPAEWADALEAMASLDPEILLPGHGPPIVGKAKVAAALLETTRWLRSLVEQTLARMNRGEKADDIVAAVKPPPELADRPYLQPKYDRPEFVVRNLLRLYGGWWNGEAADLLPAPRRERARAVAELAGGVAALVARGRALAATDVPLACHLADWAVLADPADAEAQAFRRDLYRNRADQEPSLMGRGVFDAAVREAEAALRSLGKE